MTNGQREVLRQWYLYGATEEEIAGYAGCPVAEVNIYLASWADRGCPSGEAVY